VDQDNKIIITVEVSLRIYIQTLSGFNVLNNKTDLWPKLKLDNVKPSDTIKTIRDRLRKMFFQEGQEKIIIKGKKTTDTKDEGASQTVTDRFLLRDYFSKKLGDHFSKLTVDYWNAVELRTQKKGIEGMFGTLSDSPLSSDLECDSLGDAVLYLDTRKAEANKKKAAAAEKKANKEVAAAEKKAKEEVAAAAAKNPIKTLGYLCVHY
jgi:hypothetical protein